MLDGRLDEPDWQSAPVASGFLQRDPDQGQPATEPTELRLLFDDHALYVGARLFDREPGRIVRQLSRRDALAEGDTFTLYLDPHRDRRTGVVLQVSAAGVQRDAAIYDDNFEDDTWDAVWESPVSVDAEGWSVEMRIPFSQLRFPTAPGHAWGVNARRVVHRKNESSWLVLVPKNESGLASRMTGLEGIDGIRPGRHLELPHREVRGVRPRPDRSSPAVDRGARGLPMSARGRRWQKPSAAMACPHAAAAPRTARPCPFRRRPPCPGPASPRPGSAARSGSS